MKERVNNKIENINTVVSSIDRGEKVSVEVLNRLKNKSQWYRFYTKTDYRGF